MLARVWCVGEPPDPVEGRGGSVSVDRAQCSSTPVACAAPASIAVFRLASSAASPAPLAVFPKPGLQTDMHRSWPARGRRREAGGARPAGRGRRGEAGGARPAPIAAFPKPAPQTDTHQSRPAEANGTWRGGQKGPDPRSVRGRIPRSAAKSGAASPDPLRTSLVRRFWAWRAPRACQAPSAWPPPRACRAPRVQAGQGCGPALVRGPTSCSAQARAERGGRRQGCAQSSDPELTALAAIAVSQNRIHGLVGTDLSQSGPAGPAGPAGPTDVARSTLSL